MCSDLYPKSPNSLTDVRSESYSGLDMCSDPILGLFYRQRSLCLNPTLDWICALTFCKPIKKRVMNVS